MRGSFDDPPIVVELGPTRPAILLIASLLFVAAGLALAIGPAKIIGVLEMIVFGAGAMLALVMLIQPTTLEIGPAGVAERELWGTERMAWSEAHDFRPAILGLTTRAVGFDYLIERPRDRGLHRLNSALAGVQGALQPGYELKPHQLADLLNQARERWITVSAAAAPLSAPVGTTTPSVMAGFAGARMDRKVFWVGWSALLAATLALGLIPALGPPAATIALLFGIRLYAARLHDVGRSGWWQAPLYPVQVACVLATMTAGPAAATLGLDLALLAQLVFTLAIGALPGEAAPNRFGPAPGQPSPMALAEAFR